MAIKDPDESVIALFRNFAVKNEAASAKEGRPMFDDMEVCELRFPGSKNWSAYPATSISHWHTDPLTGEQTKMTYAERFSRQYQQFKAHAQQTKSGTPLTYAMFLTEARRAELRAQNVYTVEALAAIDGQELKNLGTGGRDMKNAAIEYLAEAKKGSVNTQLQSEFEALRAKYETMESDLAALRNNAARAAIEAADRGDEFDDMTLEALREFITTHTGHAPHGSLNRKTLMRMARENQAKAA
jgi:hypothetical protein